MYWSIAAKMTALTLFPTKNILTDIRGGGGCIWSPIALNFSTDIAEGWGFQCKFIWDHCPKYLLKTSLNTSQKHPKTQTHQDWGWGGWWVCAQHHLLVGPSEGQLLVLLRCAKVGIDVTRHDNRNAFFSLVAEGK